MMLIYDNIKFGHLSVKECVSYEQCLNSLRTALEQPSNSPRTALVHHGGGYPSLTIGTHLIQTLS